MESKKGIGPRRWVIAVLLGGSLVLVAGSQATAQNGRGYAVRQQTQTSYYWTSALNIDNRQHDFGEVPTASKQEHLFEFQNTLDTDLYLDNVRASCGCTKPQILTPVVKPGEMAQVLAKYDTLGFRGHKGATVTLTLRRESPRRQMGEVQFSVKGKIRQDVVLNPGQISYENVMPGEEHVRTVVVKYAGKPNWELTDVRSSNPRLEVEARDISQNRRSGRVEYELKVRLDPSQPVGMFSDELTLVSNDQGNGEMKIAVEGRIKAIVDSSDVNLGILTQNSKVQKKLVLRGSEAFEIESIDVGDERIKIEAPEGAKSLHVLTYQLDTSLTGAVETEIRVRTNAKGQPETVIPFRAKIVSESIIADQK